MIVKEINTAMVWGVIRNVQAGLKYRGGWKGLLEHMYTNGDFPFKVGTFMGADSAGNRYYENRVDYPAGQHRWVEPGDIHNFDSTSIPPEWQGWMSHVNDIPPCAEEDFFEQGTSKLDSSCASDAQDKTHVGHQETFYNFHHLHNQTQVRSRGYGIGNQVVGLPPHAKDAYYTQPGSPYNDASVNKVEMIGSLDADGGRSYKSEKWAERLKTKEEKIQAEQEKIVSVKNMLSKRLSPKNIAMKKRGGTYAALTS